MNENKNEDYGLLYPFVVCTSNGGPYDDNAFVAGCYFGMIQQESKIIALGKQKRWCVPTPLVPQLELLAMHEGLAIITQEWDEYPDEWTFVSFNR